MNRLAVLFALVLLVGCASPAAVSQDGTKTFPTVKPQPEATQSASPQTSTPPLAVQATRDLWLISTDDFLQGRTQVGKHYAVQPPFNSAKISPDGNRALLFVTDEHRARTTYAAWIDVVDLVTQRRWRLIDQSDWWQVFDWLPDGRVVLVGSRVWLSDPAAKTLKDLGDTGGPTGAAFDGKQQVAWTTDFVPPPTQRSSEYHVHVLNLNTGKRNDFGDAYHSHIRQHTVAPLVFSPDGDRLAFVDMVEGKANVIIRDIAGGKQSRIDVDASADVSFWDRQGVWVRHRTQDSWVTVRLDDQGHEVLAIRDDSVGTPVSPDDRWLITSRSSPQTLPQPGLVDVRTGEVHWLDTNGYYPGGWAPTGELVLIQQRS